MPGSDAVGKDTMRPAAQGVKLTCDDILALPEDGLRHELIDGEHYVTVSPNLRHQVVSGRLHLLLGTWLEANPIGRVLYAPFDVKFDPSNVVVPDLIYLSYQRGQQILVPERALGAPELVIEIASPSTRRRDETIKKRLYERVGVDEYWFFDPEIDVVRLYRRRDSGFGPVEELSAEAGDVLQTTLLPGLEIRLADVFRE